MPKKVRDNPITRKHGYDNKGKKSSKDLNELTTAVSKITKKKGQGGEKSTRRWGKV